MRNIDTSPQDAAVVREYAHTLRARARAMRKEAARLAAVALTIERHLRGHAPAVEQGGAS